MRTEHTFVALFDATPEHSHFESPALLAKLRKLGAAITEGRVGIIARQSSGVVSTIFSMLEGNTAPSVALSPASNKTEHVQAFRLPMPPVPMIYTGRGALGADTIALSSASAVLVIGSYPRVLDAIMTSAKDTMIPVCILSDEEPATIHERVRARDAHLAGLLHISHDPEVLMRHLADELRRRRLSAKLGA